MSNIKIFEDKKVRTHWNAEKEEWYFSVVDIVEVLSGSSQPRKYWSDLKKKLKDEGSELSEKIGQLKLVAQDGKMRETDVLDTKGILRLIQSIPSPKAEPFKLWLAQVGSERLDEIADPEKAILRGADYYRAKGYPEAWITQRMMSIKIRKDLTNEWQERGVTKEQDYAILTNEMTKAWSGLSIQEYKKLKDLKKENLRDNMTDIELVLNMLAEVTTTTLSKQEHPETFEQNKRVAKRGGEFAGDTRKRFEKETNTKVILPLNAGKKDLLQQNKPKE
ncbi:MAG: BRO family protein [Spirochaetales bacterium]